MIKIPKSLLYDFKRTLTSKSVIAVMAVPILISLAIIPSASPQPTSSIGSEVNAQGILYFDNSGYHILLFSSNQYGQPISGVGAQFALSNSTHAYRASGITNSSGYSFITIGAPINKSYVLSGNISSPAGNFVLSFGQVGLQVYSQTGGPPRNLTEGEIMTIPIGPPAFSVVVDSSNASKRDVAVFYSAPYGAEPTNYAVYYKVYNTTSFKGNGTLPVFNESASHLLGPLNSYYNVYSLSLPKNDTCLNVVQQPQQTSGGSLQQGFPCSLAVFLGLFSQNGTLIESSEMPVFELYPPPPPPLQPNGVATQFFETVLGIFIPLMAIVGSYSSYGKDRVSGILESVLARPVSRKGLGTSRYLSTLLALTAAMVMSITLVDIILRIYTGSFVDATLTAAAISSFLVEVAAFVGLMFLFSHLVKSSGLLIGIGVVLFIVLDLFWQVIIFALTSLMGGTPSSAVYLRANIVADFFNPMQFVTLVYTYLTDQFISNPIQPSTYGITATTLVAAAVIWISLPFSLFIYRAVKKD